MRSASFTGADSSRRRVSRCRSRKYSASSTISAWRARRGGTENLIGTRILTGARPVGNGIYKGRGFVPKRNIHAPATIRQAGPDTMLVKGCVLGFICKEQRWTRVS